MAGSPPRWRWAGSRCRTRSSMRSPPISALIAARPPWRAVSRSASPTMRPSTALSASASTTAMSAAASASPSRGDERGGTLGGRGVGDRVSEQGQERVALPCAVKDGRCCVGGIGRTGGADRRVVAMTERDIRHRTLADCTGIADDAALAVGEERGVARVERADCRRSEAAVIGGEQDLRRSGILQLDKIGLVLDRERAAEAAGQRVIRGPDLDAELAERRMRQKHSAEERVMLGLDGTARASAFDALGAAATCALERA